MSKDKKHKEETVKVPSEILAAHEAANKRNATLTYNRQSKEKDFFSKTYELNIKKSYEVSMKLADGNKLMQAHIESVLLAGSGHYKK